MNQLDRAHSHPLAAELGLEHPTPEPHFKAFPSAKLEIYQCYSLENYSGPEQQKSKLWTFPKTDSPSPTFHLSLSLQADKYHSAGRKAMNGFSESNNDETIRGNENATKRGQLQLYCFKM